MPVRRPDERDESFDARLAEHDCGRWEVAVDVEPLGEARRVFEERGRCLGVDGGGAGDTREDEHRLLERPVEGEGVDVGVASARLVPAERPDRLDGVVGGVGAGEEVEPARDQDGGGEHVEVGVDVPGLVGRRPRLVVRERPRQAESLVDELYASDSFRDRVGLDVGTDRSSERPGAEQREHGRGHRRVVQSVVECVAETWRFDVGQCLTRGIAGPRGIVHRASVATAEAKTFGK